MAFTSTVNACIQISQLFNEPLRVNVGGLRDRGLIFGSRFMEFLGFGVGRLRLDAADKMFSALRLSQRCETILHHSPRFACQHCAARAGLTAGQRAR